MIPRSSMPHGERSRVPTSDLQSAGRLTRGLAAPLATLASRNPALSVTALAVTGRAGGPLAAASAAPGAGFASRGIVWRRCIQGPERQGIPQPVSVGHAHAGASAIAHRRGACCHRRQVPSGRRPCASAISTATARASQSRVGCHLSADVRGTCTAPSSAVNDRRRSSQQPRSRQGRVALPSLSLGRRCSAESRSSVAATAVRALRSEGDHMGRTAPATLMPPPGLPCLAMAGASSDLASRPAPGLV